MRAERSSRGGEVLTADRRAETRALVEGWARTNGSRVGEDEVVGRRWRMTRMVGGSSAPRSGAGQGMQAAPTVSKSGREGCVPSWTTKRAEGSTEVGCYGWGTQAMEHMKRSRERRVKWAQVVGRLGRRGEGGKAHGWRTTATWSIDIVGLATERSDRGCSRVATAAIRHSAAL